MAKGRPSNNEMLDKLRGNPGKRKKNTTMLTATDGEFGYPKSLNPEVKTKCKQVAKYLEASGVPVDYLRARFELFCLHLQAAHDANAYLRKHGAVIDDDHKNPAAQVWKDNAAAAVSICQDFDKILKNTKPKEKTVDPMEEFLKNGGKVAVVK